MNWQILGGSADGTDHTLAASGTAIIPAKKQGIRVPVQALDDDLVEGDETLLVAVASGSGYAVGGPSSAELILGDDDAVPDLSLNGLSEEQEENPGAILAVGAERMALSLNLAGSVRFGSKAILSIASGADQIRVWSAQSGGQLLLDADRPGKKWKGENLPSTLWIEAVAPSQSSGDIALTLSFYSNATATQPATDTVKATAFQVDLAIDSNNDGSITAADDLIEDDADKPGRLILANNDDDDANGIADYLDSGTVQGEDDLVAMELNILGLISGTVTLSIAAGADKVNVWLNAVKSGLGPILGGSVTQKTWDLGQQPGTVYVEAIAGSLAMADIGFTLAAAPVGTPATDTAKVTAVKLDIEAQYINQDDPADTIFRPLVPLSDGASVVYGGSEPGTADDLKLNVQMTPNGLNITNVTWQVSDESVVEHAPPTTSSSLIYDAGNIAPKPGVVDFEAIVNVGGVDFKSLFEKLARSR